MTVSWTVWHFGATATAWCPTALLIPLVDPAVGAILVVEFDEVVADVDHLRLAVVALDPRGFLHLVALQHPTLSPLFLSTFSFGEKEKKEKSGLRQVIMMRTNDLGRISGEDSTFHSLFQIMLVWHQVTFSLVTRALIAGIAPTLSISLCGFLEIWTYGT